MNYCKIKHCDIANGIGIRVSLFVAGCPYHCPGCFNEVTWDYNSGELFTDETMNEIIEEIKKPWYKGFSLLGGEPFRQDAAGTQTLIKLCEKIKQVRPDIDIWAWTGGNFEDIVQSEDKKKLLQQVDVLIDGRFILEKKDLRLRFCGSTNQRVIDVKQSLKAGQVVSWVDV